MARFRLDKLVRDNIPALIEADGDRVEYWVLEAGEHAAALVAKIKEETAELSADDPDETLKELADIQEAIDALLVRLGRSREELSEVQVTKRRRNGGFEKGLYVTVHETAPGSPWQAYYERGEPGVGIDR